jgi:hypothetical protein
MQLEFTKSRFMICEGEDDKAFLETLIQSRGLPEFQICRADECNSKGVDGKGVGGRSGFKHSLSGFKPIVGYGAVRAILLVSDNDTKDSFSEVQEAFTECGHTAPSTPQAVGTIDGRPSAVLMIPSATTFGDLELLCLPEIHRVWPGAKTCVDAFMACTGGDKWKKQSSINKTRARAAILGFHEEEPYRGIGHLFRKGLLDPSNTCFDAVADFLRNFDTFVGIAPVGTVAPPSPIQQPLPSAQPTSGK